MKIKWQSGLLSAFFVLTAAFFFSSISLHAVESDPQQDLTYTDQSDPDPLAQEDGQPDGNSLETLNPVLYLEVVTEETDAENNSILTPVAGADLTLSGKDMETRMSTTEEDLRLDLSSHLTSDESYEIQMNKAPTGYLPTDPVQFTTTNGEVALSGEYDPTRVIYSLKDNVLQLLVKPLALNLLKTSEEGESLEGAVFTVVDERETEVYTWTSSQKPEELGSYLNAGGTYTIQEVTPPQGYTAVQAITFTIGRDGTIDIVEDEDEAVTLLPKHDQIQVKNEKAPEEPEEPTEEPEKPEQPETPQEPEKPEEPETPKEPETPEEPEKPSVPQKPSTPASEKPEVTTAAAAAVPFYTRILILSSLGGLAIALAAGKRR